MITSTAPLLTYIACDVPEGQTLAEWRRLRAESKRRRFKRHMPRRALRYAMNH